ncbi:MAG: hypothetical protein EBS01_09040 [Verrucomicrobia bacterium]|nr:hypothetical protein [Verrucomicrobiota bacterium]
MFLLRVHRIRSGAALGKSFGRKGSLLAGLILLERGGSRLYLPAVRGDNQTGLKTKTRLPSDGPSLHSAAGILKVKHSIE